MAQDRFAVCRVFLASPGGVDREREAARDVINKANARLGDSMQMHFQVVGWEDVSIGAGRAQDLINPEVERCDLFLGIVGDKWGRPTGGHSAGFKEEFELAFRLREQSPSHKPDIWVFFKEVPQDKLEDKGPQLLQVEEFRSDLENRERVFHRGFKDANWRETLLLELGSYMLRTYAAAQEGTPEQDTGSSPPATGAEGDRGGGPSPRQGTEEAPEYPSQVTDLVRAVQDGLGTKWPDEATLDQIARFHLLGSAWFSRVHTARTLDVHELNTYYKAREHLNLSGDEWWLLVRSFIANKSDTGPGMFWMRLASEEQFAAFLFERARADSEEVRGGALRLLALTEYVPPEGWVDSMVAAESTQVRMALLDFLKRREPEWGIGVAKRLMADSDFLVRAEADQMHLVLLAAHDPHAALGKAARRSLEIEEPVSAKLRSRLAELQDDELRASLSARNAGTRSMVGKELARRGKLSDAEARQLGEDKSPIVAEVGLGWLLRATDEPGEELLNWCKEKAPSLLEQRKMAQLREMEVEELLSRIDFYEIDAPHAYRVLALHHFDRVKDRLRRDLREGFQSLKAQSELNFLGKMPVDASDAAKKAAGDLLARLRELNEPISARFTEAALAGLAQHGGCEDATSARRAIEQEDQYDETLREAVNLLARFGNREDAFALLTLAKEKYGDLRELAESAAADILTAQGSRADAERLVTAAKAASGEAQAALARAAMKLTPGLKGAPGKLLESGEPALVRLAFCELLGKGQGTRKRRAVRLLMSENGAIRDAAVSFLANVCDNALLRAVLGEYLELPSHYYSVVCALDRLLYAPGALGDAFRSEIKAVVKEPKIESTRRGPWGRRRWQPTLVPGAFGG